MMSLLTSFTRVFFFYARLAANVCFSPAEAESLQVPGAMKDDGSVPGDNMAEYFVMNSLQSKQDTMDRLLVYMS